MWAETKEKRKFKTYLIDEILKKDEDHSDDSKDRASEKLMRTAERLADHSSPCTGSVRPSKAQSSLVGNGPSSSTGNSTGSAIPSSSLYSEMLGNLAQGLEGQQVSQQMYYNYFYQALVSGQSDFKPLHGSITSASSSTCTRVDSSKGTDKFPQENKHSCHYYLSSIAQSKKL